MPGGDPFVTHFGIGQHDLVVVHHVVEEDLDLDLGVIDFRPRPHFYPDAERSRVWASGS